MSKILVTTLPHEGHLNPTFGIAAALRKRGHTITYLGHPLIDQAIRNQGYPILDNRKFGLGDLGFLLNMLLLRNSTGKREMKLAMKLFTTRLKPQVGHITKLLNSYKPDIIINDAFNYATAIASEINATPWVDCWTAGMMHPAAEPYLGPTSRESMLEMLAFFDTRINKVRTSFRLGSKPNGSFLQPSAWLQVYTSCAEIEPKLPPLGPTAVCIGPCIGDRQEEPIDIDSLFSQKYRQYPLVYASFGTFFNRDKNSIKKLIESAKGQNFRMLISTPLAKQMKADFPCNSNVVLLDRVPQRHVLEHTQLFVTHGGNNSTQEALTAGVPMLVTPIAGEQQYNAERVRWLGVGDIIDVKTDSAQEIAYQISAAINDDKFLIKAAEIKQALERYDAPETAANFIEEILESKQPYRPA